MSADFGGQLETLFRRPGDPVTRRYSPPEKQKSRVSSRRRAGGSKPSYWRNDSLTASNSTWCAGSVTPLWIDFPTEGNDWPLTHIAARLWHDAEFRARFREALQRAQKKITETCFFSPRSFSMLLLPTACRAISPCRSPNVFRRRSLSRASGSTGPFCQHSKSSRFPVHSIDQLKTKRLGVHSGTSGRVTRGNARIGVSVGPYVLATGKFFGGGLSLGYDTSHRIGLRLASLSCTKQQPSSTPD